MITDDFKKLAMSPDFIEGIFNYCDRWCIHCSFTKRCIHFMLEEDADEETKNVDNIKFWKKFAKNLRLVAELLETSTGKKVADTSNFDRYEKNISEEKTLLKIIHTKQCAIESKKYSGIAIEWLETHYNLLAGKQDEINELLQIGDNPEKLNNLAKNITDAIDIINWYMFFIHIKTMRALHEKYKHESPNFISDPNGSAKIALIGCDRTINAWAFLLSTFPEEEDSIIEILAKLEKIRRLLEYEFPHARAFHRPGFDD